MMTVWKFELYSHRQAIKAPGLGRLLHVAIQDGRPMVWAEVDTEHEDRHCVVDTVGTGMKVLDDLVYVGTFHEQTLVWHVYSTEPTS